MLKRVSSVAFAVFLFCLAGGSAALAAEPGKVTGTVIDSENNIKLMGVLVTNQDNSRKAVSNRQGEFSLILPAGEQSLTFSYLGYEPVTRTVVVKENETATLDIDLGAETVAMDEMVVQGQAVGQARALNRQKTAPNLTNIVASDAFGRFPDQNAAEALNRLPGVSVERDQGEGRFVIVRGIDPNLNSVSIDGVALAAPDDSSRAVLLDVIPMNVMETLVVTKALTADMPADSIGGHIEIETPSAFDRNQMTLDATAGVNYADLTDQYAPSGSLTFGNTFGQGNKFGFLGSVSYDRRDYGSDNVEADPWEQNDDGAWVTEEIQYREYDLTRERFGATANLEYKPSENNLFFLRGVFSEFTDHEIRRLTAITDMEMTPDASGNAGTIGGDDLTTSSELKDREETQLNWTLSAGGEQQAGSWSWDYSLAYSYAEQDTPDDTEIVYENTTLSYSYSDAATDTPSVAVTGGDLLDLSSYELDGVEDADQIVEEDAWIFQGNLKKSFRLPLQSYLKTGYYVSLRNKNNDTEVWTSDDNPAAFDTLEGNTGDGRREYSDFPLLSSNLVERFRRNSGAFAMERDLVDSEGQDYDTDENIYAGYLMGQVDFGRVSLLPGVRYEYTELKATGNVVDAEAEAVLGSETRKHHYDNILPSIHVRAALTDNLILNAAWTNSISRPTWEQTKYARVEDDGEVEVGNPDLDPYEAMNWDATLTYYAPKLGMASAGVFYKDIDNFIYSQTSFEDDFDLISWRNGDGGHIAGVELAGRLELASLTPLLEGFSIQGNIALTDSRAKILPAEEGGESRSVDFIRNSDTVGSAAISYEKYGFFLRLSGTYRSSYLDEVGEESFEDRYIDDHFQLDLSTAYTYKERYTVFANFINLTDEPLKAYWGESNRLSQYEKYGWSARIGLKFAL
ncbi:MAG: TonB-dependent receptor [Syntrophotaleaceae bacterium]